MRYISLFSGIGGLEFANHAPILCCEIDRTCHAILQDRFPNADIEPDVSDLRPPKSDVVVGGWPCQDISVAGRRRGLSGKNSGLFFDLLRVAKEADAETIVAENVPHLLRMHSGETMCAVLEGFWDRGWKNIAWRTLNARAFGLPQQRERVFIVASKRRDLPLNLFRPLPRFTQAKSNRKTAGFYTTAGSRSLCYSKGFVPALKVGSALSIPSPPGIHLGKVIRKATANECIRLQGFDVELFDSLPAKDIHRMMGNAVAKPVGAFVTATCEGSDFAPQDFRLTGRARRHGFYDGKIYEVLDVDEGEWATNLSSFIDPDVDDRISPRAASGLLRRLKRSGVWCPEDLLELLYHYSKMQ